MNEEVTQGVKNIIINSYIQPIPVPQMFYLVYYYIKDRKNIEIESNLALKTAEDYEALSIAFEYARSWFESKYEMLKLYTRKDELIAVSFGPFIRQGNANGPISRLAS